MVGVARVGVERVRDMDTHAAIVWRNKRGKKKRNGRIRKTCWYECVRSHTNSNSRALGIWHCLKKKEHNAIPTCSPHGPFKSVLPLLSILFSLFFSLPHLYFYLSRIKSPFLTILLPRLLPSYHLFLHFFFFWPQ